MKKNLCVVAVFSVLFCAVSFAAGFEVPKAGDKITPSDYSLPDNWLNVPKKTGKKVDVFFVYPTSWRARGAYPIADITNQEMREWALYYLKYRASVFEQDANVFAPYYRQLDALYATEAARSKGVNSALAEYSGVPAADVAAAFDYYIKHFNQGRPFILAGHSQGSIVLLSLLTGYLKDNPQVYDRMIAAYVIGMPVLKETYALNPHLKPARNAQDTGVIISYNVQSANPKGVNPMANPDAVLINPLNWKTDGTYADKKENAGSLQVSVDGKSVKRKGIADAKIDLAKGTLICSTVDEETWSSEEASRSYFPLGVFHENDIPLYYYNLKQNVKVRIKTYFEKNGR